MFGPCEKERESGEGGVNKNNYFHSSVATSTMSSHPPQEPPLAVTVARINPCQHFEMTRARESVWESACPAHRHPMPHFEPIGKLSRRGTEAVTTLLKIDPGGSGLGEGDKALHEALYKFTVYKNLHTPWKWLGNATQGVSAATVKSRAKRELTQWFDEKQKAWNLEEMKTILLDWATTYELGEKEKEDMNKYVTYMCGKRE